MIAEGEVPGRGARVLLRGGAVGLSAAILFLLLASVNLGGTGVYYDELLQAPAAFDWIGERSPFFATGRVFDLPLFNLTYVGAIKSSLYGAWLWLSGEPFTLVSWRWIGLLAVAAGILAFSLLVAGHLPAPALAVFLVLLTTDVTVLVGVRHDWGPVALALGLRLALLGVWIRSRSAPTPWSTFCIGALLGLLVYEKLSSVVLLPPVLALLFAGPERRSRVHGAALVIGGLLACAPVLGKNLVTLATEGRLFSLGNLTGSGAHDAASALSIGTGCLTLGAGAEVRAFVLGLPSGVVASWVEGTLLLAAVALATGLGGRPARLCAIGFGLVVSGLFVLPETKWVHHWILVTPFPYLAVAFGLAAASPARRRGRWIALLAVTAVLVLARAPGVVEVVRAFAAGRSSQLFSDDLRTLSRFAAAQPPTAHFVAANWGTAVPIYCFAQGRPGLVTERVRNGDDPEGRRIDLSRFDTVYLVTLNPVSRPGKAGSGKGVASGLEARLLSLPGWHRVPAPGAVAALTDVRVVRFAR